VWPPKRSRCIIVNECTLIKSGSAKNEFYFGSICFTNPSFCVCDFSPSFFLNITLFCFVLFLLAVLDLVYYVRLHVRCPSVQCKCRFRFVLSIRVQNNSFFRSLGLMHDVECQKSLWNKPVDLHLQLFALASQMKSDSFLSNSFICSQLIYQSSKLLFVIADKN